VRTVPKVPVPALRQFRVDLPPSEAAMARAVSTRMAWDSPNGNRSPRDGVDAQEALFGSDSNEGLWSAVDERTMDPYYYMRMRRQQSIRAPDGGTTGADAISRPSAVQRSRQFGAPLAGKLKRSCRLSDERGRVSVDFREVATLREFVNEHGKIVNRRKSALSAKGQRKVARAVKTARQMALLHPEPKPGLTLEEMRRMAVETGL
jgi:small subunit ribosomal protein S18